MEEKRNLRTRVWAKEQEDAELRSDHKAALPKKWRENYRKLKM